MIEFLAGILVGVILSVVILFLGKNRREATDPADWWKRGERNPYEDFQED